MARSLANLHSQLKVLPATSSNSKVHRNIAIYTIHPSALGLLSVYCELTLLAEHTPMPMNTAAAFGIYNQDVALTDIVHTLNEAGFENEDICMMLSPAHPIASVVRDASLFSSKRDDSASTAGMIGWLSAFGAVLIPTVGFFIRSQAFLHALMAKEAPALCGNARTLVGLGFSEDEAEKYEHQLRRLGVLVYVSCAESAKTVWAQEVLRHTGAHETSTLRENLEDAVALTMSAAASA